MTTRTSSARWQGDLKGGSGSLALGSGAFEGQYNFTSRFEEGVGTNPEELIAAALAGCYSMALSNALATAGFTPDFVETNVTVHLGRVDGARIDFGLRAADRGAVSAVSGWFHAGGISAVSASGPATGGDDSDACGGGDAGARRSASEWRDDQRHERAGQRRV